MDEQRSVTPTKELLKHEGLDPSEAIQFLADASYQADHLAREMFGKVSGSVKEEDPNQVLTEVDQKVGQLLIELTKKRYPQAGIIDEEVGVIQGSSLITFTFDPVDGTAFLASGDMKWGSMIGIVYDGIPIGGTFSLPTVNGGITCLSMESQGVWLRTGKNIEQVRRLNTEINLRKLIIDFGADTYFKQEHGTTIPDGTKNDQTAILQARFREKVRKLEAGGSPYGWIQMMQGSYSGSLCYKSSKIWDRVPVHHAIVALGGVVTEFNGSPIDYKTAIDNPDTVMSRKFGVCAASNVQVYQQLQTIIHANRELWQNI